ncbi:Histidinol-phosphate aminotransferase [Diplonema papillatum]|nr:Histidinol-phosphate aminotransferase [Diplonema papillatum]|eukprot:gene10183-15662_t
MTSFNLRSLVRPNIWNLEAYTCARDEFAEAKEVMLDANENALGACLSTTGKQSTKYLRSLHLERYPDPKVLAVKEQLVALRNPSLSPSNLFLGVGSDEAIDLAIRVFCEPGKDKILQCPPTYGMYNVSAATNNVGVVNVPLLKESFALDEQEVLRAVKADPAIKIVFICSPNNPTGNVIDRRSIVSLLEQFNGIVVVDEAYVDFSGEGSWCSRVGDFPNLVVMQTFSKSFGLAAIRLGAAYGTPDVISIFNKVKAPYNISALTASVALGALENNAADMRKKVQILLGERRRILNELPKLRVVEKVYRSDANYLLVKVADAGSVYNYLAENNVVVRNRSSQPGCHNCLRVTVGTKAENDTLLRLLRSFRSLAKL